MDDDKTPSPTYLSIGSQTLRKAWDDADNSGCCDGPSFSTLGARILAGEENAIEIGEVAFHWPSGEGPRGTVFTWDDGLTQITIKRKQDSKLSVGISAYQLLDELGDPASNEGKMEYIYRENDSFQFNLIKTAVHMACPVECFDRPLKPKQKPRPPVTPTAPRREKQVDIDLECVRLIEPLDSIGPVGPLSVWELKLPNKRCSTTVVNKVKAACKVFDVLAITDDDLGNIADPSPWQVIVGLFNNEVSQRRSSVESQVKQLLVSGIGRDNMGYVLVRTRDLGCLVATREPTGREVKCRFDWLPDAYNLVSFFMDNVKLPGAGTLFVGAFTYAMAKGQPAIEAAKQGMAAVSFLLQLEHERTRPLVHLIDVKTRKIEFGLWHSACRGHCRASDLTPQTNIQGEERWKGCTFAERRAHFETGHGGIVALLKPGLIVIPVPVNKPDPHAELRPDLPILGAKNMR